MNENSKIVNKIKFEAFFFIQSNVSVNFQLNQRCFKGCDVKIQ
jgi:hypothetical protein